MSSRYRIVKDCYLGFEAQYRPWWSPFWLQCGELYGVGSNTHKSSALAEEFAKQHASKPYIKYLGKLP